MLFRSNSDVVLGTNEIIGQYSPQWRRDERSGQRKEDIIPGWSAGRFRLATFHRYEATLPFTRMSWRGRIRASRWIGASLSRERVAEFDVRLKEFLARNAPPRFGIPHRISLSVFEPLQCPDAGFGGACPPRSRAVA